MFFSIQFKGTDKFPNGFPHFWEKCKEDSANGERLKIHIDIACVHGSKPYVFLGYENMYSDPNMTCEVLYRTLRAEQEERGGLPDTLYLQLDNCIRENKNTVLFCYICWLVERGIFKTAYVSFLPVGHTHFDCDQVASRIAIAMKYRDVTAIDQLVTLLEQCNFPSPNVEFIDGVADVKGLFNPTGKPTFPVTESRVQRLHGCCTHEPPTGVRKEFMNSTSPLHWQVRRDLQGNVLLQSKLICDDDQWSAQHYPWTPAAPRPCDRNFEEGTSGLRPSDLRMAAQKPLGPTRRKELQASLPAVQEKLTEEEWAEVVAIWESLVRDMNLEDNPVPNAGLFIGEDDEPIPQEEEVPDKEQHMFLRPPTRVFQNTNRQVIDRENRKRRGRATAELVIGNMVAVTGNYEDTVVEEDKHDFWVGKILEMDYEQSMLHLAYYSTGVKRCVESNNAKYRAFQGAGGRDWVNISRVLHTFKKFTPGNRIEAMERRRIRDALQLPADEDDIETNVMVASDAN